MSLTVIIAPMFSGKTSYLLTQASISFDLKFKPVFITHSLETRSNNIYTHSSIVQPIADKLPTIKTQSLKESQDSLLQYSHIFIDEFQFFSKDDIEVIEKFVSNKKNVVVAGLKADSNNKKFGFLIDLIPLADDVVFLNSYCMVCAEYKDKIKAPFTKRLCCDTEQVLVGNSDKYIPVCRKHYEMFY